MRLIRRYIGFTVIKLTLLVLLVVLGMEFFINIIGEFSDIGHGNYGLFQALIYVLLTLPTNLYSLFPMIGLLGSLIGLGSLATSSELVVMRTAGISVLRIIGAVLVAALLMIVVITFIGEFVAPSAQHLADRTKILAESGGQAAETAQGIWFKSDNTFVNVKMILPDMQMQGITEYRFDNSNQLESELYAQQAEKQNGQWYLLNVQQSILSANQVTTKTVAKLPWDMKINSHLLGVTKNNTNEMNLWELFRYIEYKNNHGISAAGFALSFWQRLFQPIATLVMIFLAVPFVFGPLRSVTMGVRIVTGAVMGFTFYLLNQFFGPFSLVYQIPPIIGASLPIVLFAILALVLMRRVK